MDNEFNIEDLIPLPEDFNIDTLETDNDKKEPVEDKEEIKKEEAVIDTQDTQTDDTEIDEEAVNVFNTLKATNLFDDETEVKSWDDLEGVLNELPQKIYNEFLESSPEKYRKLLKLVYENPEATDEDLSEIFNAYKADNKVTGDFNSDSAREYLTNEFKAKGIDEDIISAQLDKLEDDDKLIDKAKEAYQKNYKSKQDELLAKVEQEKQAREKQMLERTETINNTFKEFNWQESRVKKVKQTLASLNDLNVAIFNNPKSLIQLGDILSHYNPKTGDFDLEYLKKQGESQATSKLQNLWNKDKGSRSKSTGLNNKNHQDDTDDLVPIY